MTFPILGQWFVVNLGVWQCGAYKENVGVDGFGVKGKEAKLDQTESERERWRGFYLVRTAEPNPALERSWTFPLHIHPKHV